MFYTLSQAAKVIHKSKATIFKAIKKGTLSANKNEKGEYQIDPSELYRVFPDKQQNERQSEPGRTKANDTEATLLEEKIKLLEREVKRLEQTGEDLREDRDQWRRQATFLLSHQPESKNEPKKEAKGLFQRLFPNWK